MSYINLKVTKVQLLAIIDQTDDMSAMIGEGRHDEAFSRNVKTIDRMLNKNGYKRTHN